MEDPPPVALVRSPKRSYEAVEPVVSTPERAPPSNASSTPLTDLSTVPSPSPVKSAAPTNMDAKAAAPPLAAPAFNTAQQPAKRRKLTAQEKEDQRLEKEAKDKARVERKAQKEAEDKAKAELKAQKEEQKRLRDDEKRKKNEEREEKKRAKELEQQQKEEEKQKKERSQMRLNAFFAKPKPAVATATGASVDTIPISNPDSVSLAPDVVMDEANANYVSPQKPKCDYERVFLPFQLQSHSILAPYNRFAEDPNQIAATTARMDKFLLSAQAPAESIGLESFKAQFGDRRKRGLRMPPISQLVDRINGSSGNPIDLTKEGMRLSNHPLESLKQIPMKYLHFGEDVRPPYYGTFSRTVTDEQASKLSRNPHSRTLDEIDYDYDSEAEWEEPEEGEDLDSEGDDDMSEDGEDDMDGFLDDDDDAQVKRRLISGDLVPVSSGICWEDSEGVSKLNDGSGAISTEFKDFKMAFLLEPQPQSIDPFSSAYWAPDVKESNSPMGLFSREGTSNGSMQPPRMPLAQRPINGMLAASATAKSGVMSKPVKPAKRMIPTDQLAAFKAEVNGSDLTKIALVEALKKKFPKLPKDAITNTLSAVAARKGSKEVEKRWVLLN